MVIFLKHEKNGDECNLLDTGEDADSGTRERKLTGMEGLRDGLLTGSCAELDAVLGRGHVCQG